MDTQHSKPRRYYGDDGHVDKTLNLAPMCQLLHAAFTHWLGRGYHGRDFVCAVEHCATIAFGTFLLDGQLRPTGDIVLPVIARAPVRKTVLSTPALRLYDELEDLNPDIDTSVLDTALAALFSHWLGQNAHARDFILAAKEQAVVILYDYHTCCAMGGLGGGKSGPQFLSEAYYG